MKGQAMNRGRVCVLGLFVTAIVASCLGGCSSGPSKEEYDAVLLENSQLRDRLRAMHASNASNEATLNARMEALNAELDSMRTSQPGSATGFEGIANVGSGLNSYGEVVVDIAGDVLFDSGSVTLKGDAKNTLDRVAGVLRSQYAGHTIRIEGYTDSDPIRKSKWGTNERLSFERANAVEEYLASKGINKDQIYTAAFGPSKPRGNKQQSRRVEIVILGS